MLDKAHLYKYILGVCTQDNSSTSLRQSHDHVQASFQSSFCLHNSSKYNQATGDSQRLVIEITLITNCFDLMQSSCPSLQTKSLKLLGAVVVFFILVVVIVLEVAHDKHRQELIISVLCAVFSVGMYASLLTVMVDPDYYTPSPIPFLPSE
jgi:hypothetical protein